MNLVVTFLVHLVRVVFLPVHLRTATIWVCRSVNFDRTTDLVRANTKDRITTRFGYIYIRSLPTPTVITFRSRQSWSCTIIKFRLEQNQGAVIFRPSGQSHGASHKVQVRTESWSCIVIKFHCL